MAKPNFIVILSLDGAVKAGSEVRLSYVDDPMATLPAIVQGTECEFAPLGVSITKALLLKRGQRREDGEALDLGALLGHGGHA